MTEIITATFLNGAFVPETDTHVPAGARVRLVVQSLGEENARNEAIQEFNDLCARVSVEDGQHLTRQQLHDRY